MMKLSIEVHSPQAAAVKGRVGILAKMRGRL